MYLHAILIYRALRRGHSTDDGREQEDAVSARIGGNLADITRTAGVMTDTGGAATTTGHDASAVAARMEGEIDAITVTLRTHFEQLAGDLRGRIANARQQLGATDWEGASRSAADAAEVRLHGEVDRVLATAVDDVEAFRAFMTSQATDFVGGVQGRLGGVMGQIDAAYQELAAGSRAFAEQLETADRSISFGR